MGFPTRQDEAALHERVLATDPVASADVFAAFVDPLVAAIQRDLRCDSDTARDSAIDAIFEYLGAPSSYHPSKGRLSTFLAHITKRRATDRIRARSAEARRKQEFGSVVELRASAPKEEMERAVVARELWHKVELQVWRRRHQARPWCRRSSGVLSVFLNSRVLLLAAIRP